MNILVIDTKLLMYTQHHKHKPTLGFLEEISNLALDLLPHIHKVIFLKDKGKSKRVAIFPNYKGKREETKKKQPAGEKVRLKKFLNTYNTSDEFLKLFGSVVAINGIEADDLASMISKRLGGVHSIYLMSGDADWSRFLVNSNTYMVHPTRKSLITLNDTEEEFGVVADYKLLIDSTTGVDKESVDGITKLGMKRAVGFLKLADYDQDEFFKLLDDALAVKKFGMVLPSWANSAREVYERNIKIFEAHTYDSLTDAEQQQFLEGWSHQPCRDYNDIVKSSMTTFGNPYIPSMRVMDFFRITGG